MISVKSEQLDNFLADEDFFMLALLYSKMYNKLGQDPEAVQKWFTSSQPSLGNISPLRMVLIGQLEALYVTVMSQS